MRSLAAASSVVRCCGWGGFCTFAAQEYGARVTALTISDAQLAYTRKRVAAAAVSRTDPRTAVPGQATFRPLARRS